MTVGCGGMLQSTIRYITSLCLLGQIVFAPILSLPREAYAVNGSDSFEISCKPYDQYPPEQITDLTSFSVSIRTGEGRVKLAWTAPREDSFPITSKNPVGGYLVRFASYSIQSLGSDTTAWWESAYEYQINGANQPGDPEVTPTLYLTPGQTYYFAVKSFDNDKDGKPDCITSLIDTRADSIVDQVFILGTETDFAPYTPEGLTILSVTTYYVRLAWTDLSTSSKTEDFDFYRIYRSTTAGEYGQAISTTSSITIDDNNIIFDATSYYRISGVDKPPLVLESALSEPVTAYISSPDKVPPLPVTDLTAQGTINEGEITLSWTTPYDEGTGVKEYLINYFQASVNSDIFMGNTTAWWNASAGAGNQFIVSASSPVGEKQYKTINYPAVNIMPGATYYFAIKAVDYVSRVSVIDTKTSTPFQQAYAWSRDIAPSTPYGLTVLSATTAQVSLSWTDLTDAEKTLDFGSYRVYRSSAEGLAVQLLHRKSISRQAAIFLPVWLTMSNSSMHCSVSISVNSL